MHCDWSNLASAMTGGLESKRGIPSVFRIIALSVSLALCTSEVSFTGLGSSLVLLRSDSVPSP